MKHIERGQLNLDKFVKSDLDNGLKSHPDRLPQYLLMPSSILGNLNTGINLSEQDGCERGQFIYSIPSTKDIIFMLWKKSTFFVIGSPNSTNFLFVSTQKSRSYSKEQKTSLRVINRLTKDSSYCEMSKGAKIRFITSFGFGVYQQLKYNSDSDYLWKKSR